LILCNFRSEFRDYFVCLNLLNSEKGEFLILELNLSTLVLRIQVLFSSVINSDGWRGYNGLVDLGYGHFRIDHSKDEFSRGSVHINGIEEFWGFAKVRLAKFKGIPDSTFHLHLKETEWRFNNRHSDKYKNLLSTLRNFRLARQNPRILFKC